MILKSFLDFLKGGGRGIGEDEIGKKLNDYSESLCYIATGNIIEKAKKRERKWQKTRILALRKV